MAGNLTAMIAAAFAGSAVTADPYYEYTTLLLPGNGTNGAQNNTFLDASTNNFTITRNGNTTQGTFSPFSQTGWGNYFDGTGDYLSVPDNAALEFGSSNFTLEFWYYPVAEESLDALVTKGWPTVFAPFLIAQGSAGRIDLYASTNGSSWDIASAVAFGTGIALNAWHHVVMTRSGNTLGLFVDGVRGNTVDVTAKSFQNNTYNLTIGASVTGSNAANTYVSNFRMVVGSSVYDPTQTTLTVPTAPLTAITNTSLLTCQSNRFIDNSTNNFTITRNGDTRVVAFSPFNPTASWSAATYGGSGYFDGSGDYLSVADNANLRLGTSAFTIQAWVYRNASGTAHSIIAKGGASTGYVLQVTSTNVLRFTHGTTNVDTTTTIPASAWTHVAAVRTNTSTNGFQLYINGVSSATATVSTDFNQTDALYIGGDRSAANVMNGYISGLKYTNGTAETISVPTEPPTATTNVALLTNFTNAGIYDATSKNDLETVGNAQISTTQSKWGSTSIKFDGTGDYLAASRSIPEYDLGTGNFTIEFWVNLAALPGASAYPGVIGRSEGSGALTQWVLNIAPNGTGIGFNVMQSSGTWTSSGPSSNTPQLVVGTWYHVALVRVGTGATDMKLYVDGTLRASSTSNPSLEVNTTPRTLVIGKQGVSEFMNGYIQDLRITRGYARYTANFTPPTAAFPTL